MRIPRFILNTPVIVQNKLGNSAYGEQYGEPYGTKVRFESTKKKIKTAKGSEVVCAGIMFFNPEDKVGVEDKVTLGNIRYTVVEIIPESDLMGFVYFEVYVS